MGSPLPWWATLQAYRKTQPAPLLTCCQAARFMQAAIWHCGRSCGVLKFHLLQLWCRLAVYWICATQTARSWEVAQTIMQTSPGWARLLDS